jgi:DNA-binding MarR family transcriptional regulator
MDTSLSPGSKPTVTPPSAGQRDVVELAARLRLAVARLNRQLRQQAGTGLSPSQQSVLTSIEANESLTLGELAAIEQVAPPTITKIVAKLEEDGLVARSVDAVDRRIARVTITGEGHRRLEHSRSRRNAWLAMRLRELTTDEIACLSPAVEVLEAMACAPPRPSPPGDELEAARSMTP